MNQRKLEEYAWFPYVAWTLTVVFAGYVMYLAFDLRDKANTLQDSTLSLEFRIEQIERMLHEQTREIREANGVNDEMTVE